jgi:acetyl esterase/lipase
MVFLYKKLCALVLALCLVAIPAAEAKTGIIEIETGTVDVGLHQDVTYAQYMGWPESRLKMDIYIPNNGQKSAAVVFIPGGWWLTTPKSAGVQMGTKLAEEGFAVASIEHRLLAAANYKDVIGDVKAAIRYLRAHADELNIDKNRIAVMGTSAGGYLATMAGVTGDTRDFDFGENLDQESRVQAVVDFFGPTDLTKTGADYSEDVQRLYASPGSPVSLLANGTPIYKNNTGGSILETPDTALATNPMTYIGKNTPPFLIMHGNADKTVSHSQSDLLYNALEQNGTYAEYYTINNGEHRFKYFIQPKTFRIIVDFLNRVL